jgi:hypothetical protein
MLRCICGHTRRDHIRKDDTRERLRVTPVGGETCATSFEMVWTYPRETEEDQT